MDKNNDNNQYTLLYDGQCTICRYLIKTFIEPHKTSELNLKPFQSAEFDKEYPPEQLERCKAEIILVNENESEKEKSFLGGIDAVLKTLELTKLFPVLQAWLRIPFLRPLNHFGYRLIAWNRYTWFIVPPHLRCADCELEIPLLWNTIYFVLFSVILLITTYFNLFTWFSSLVDSAPQLFKLINKEFFLLPLCTTFFSAIFSSIFPVILFSNYKKVLGLKRIEIFKQYLLLTTLSGFLTLVFIFIPNIFPVNLKLLTLSSYLIMSVLITQILIYRRLRELNFENKFVLILCLILEFILKLLTPFLILRFI